MVVAKRRKKPGKASASARASRGARRLASRLDGSFLLPQPIVRHGVHPGIPEWEAMKSVCRNLSHADAVAECAYLSEEYRTRMRPMTTKVELKRILQVLNQKKIPFVLTGAYGISGWTGRPRSTYDVDILVKGGRNCARAVKALKELYPDLKVRTFHGVNAFFVPGETESVIDVTYPHRDDQIVTLQTAVWFEEQGEKCRVPSLECALANKYGASLSLPRDSGKRAQDVVDFYFMVKHSQDEGRQPIDLKVLEELGEKVWPGGGGKEILHMVEQAKAGVTPNLNPPGRLP
jgi:hypothetical protein